jgi:DNA primase
LKFTQEFIERVSEASNIVDIISQHTQLKPAGGGLMGRCPFPDHPEKTPSFSVSESKQVYNCFGCHKKGNIFTFLQQYNGMSFREAIEYLAARANIAMPQMNPEEASKQDVVAQKKKLLIRVNKMAASYFHENFKKLPSNHPVREYARKRGLSDQIIDTFQVGYASEEWDGLVLNLESKNVPMTLAEEARLVKARSGGKTGYFDIFRDRLIFPIFSMMGDAIAFGGRIIAQGEPKYLNSPETQVFHKGKILYGLSQTAKFIRSEDQAIVVEGYMDLVSLYQAGIPNVVATMGTALTADHGRILNRITKNIVVLFDGDSAGREAAERSLPLLLGADVYPKGLVLPDNQDPDDFVKNHGAEALKKLVSEAPDLFSMILGMWLHGYRGEASEKVRISTLLQPVFQSIQDPRLKGLYLKEAAGRMNVDEKWLREALTPQRNDFGQKGPSEPFTKRHFTSQNSTSAPSQQNSHQAPSPELKDSLTEETRDQIQLKGASKVEIVLLGLVLKNHANFEVLSQAQSLEEIPNKGVQEVLKRATEVSRQAPEKFDKLVSLLATFVDHPEWLITATPLESGDDSKIILDCVRKLKEQNIVAKRKQLTLELKSSSGSATDPSRHEELMKALMELKKEELQLKAERL